MTVRRHFKKAYLRAGASISSVVARFGAAFNANSMKKLISIRITRVVTAKKWTEARLTALIKSYLLFRSQISMTINPW
jgi:hypothetical protein